MGTNLINENTSKLAKSCFHSINVPSEWELVTWLQQIISQLSFHSINVPSEWEHHSAPKAKRPNQKGYKVSIQLMSPASGNSTNTARNNKLKISFHSINVPSEWERTKHLIKTIWSRFHSINVPSEWEQGVLATARHSLWGFHSINVPSEWERVLAWVLAFGLVFPFN